MSGNFPDLMKTINPTYSGDLLTDLQYEKSEEDCTEAHDNQIPDSHLHRANLGNKGSLIACRGAETRPAAGFMLTAGCARRQRDGSEGAGRRNCQPRTLCPVSTVEMKGK